MLADNIQSDRRAPKASGAILTGRIFDDRNNIMTPTYSVKGSLRYRYYVSRACVEGRKSEKGAVHRVPAYEVESEILKALRTIELTSGFDAPDQILMSRVSQVKIERGYITVSLTASDAGEISSPIRIKWVPKPKKAKRDIVLPHTDSSKDHRPIQVEQRDRLLRAVAKGRSWLKELLASKTGDTDLIATREGRSKRSVQMMISLAFVAPDIIEAAVKGALPRGIGLTRLMDLPPLWSEQRKQLGLRA